MGSVCSVPPNNFLFEGTVPPNNLDFKLEVNKADLICCGTTGTAMLIWSFVWMTCVSNDPSTDKFISEKEKTYLAREITYFSKEKVKLSIER